MDKNMQSMVSEAFYVAPTEIVQQMKNLEDELDSIYAAIKAKRLAAKSAGVAPDITALRARQKELEESMELMSQLLCMAKKV